MRSGIAPCGTPPGNDWVEFGTDFEASEGVAGGGIPMAALLSPVSRRFIASSGPSVGRSRLSVGIDGGVINWPFARAMSRAKMVGIAA